MAPNTFAGALVALVLSVVLPISVLASSAPPCLCEFNPSTDYFPIKLTAGEATGYEIEYFNAYKKITVQTSSGPFVTIAYMCGSPEPSESADLKISIPIDSVTIESTTFLPFIRYLGKDNALFFASTDATELPACQKVRANANVLSTGYSLAAANNTVTNNSLSFTSENLDLILADSFSYGGAVSTISQNFNNFHTKAIQIPQENEKHPLGAIDWIKPIAALFNSEAKAAYTMNSITGRYNCLKSIVAVLDAPKKKVLWGNYNNYNWDPTTETFSGAVCPNYYCKLIEDAGAEIISFPNSAPNMTTFAAAVAEADYWIYVDGNFNTSTPYQNPFTDSANIGLFNSAGVFTNQKIFDIRGGYFSGDWFEDRIARPDELLADLTQILYGTSVITELREKRFLRNVFSEAADDQTSRDAVNCNLSESPYTAWLSGTCSQPAPTGSLDDTNLCPSNLRGRK